MTNTNKLNHHRSVWVVVWATIFLVLAVMSGLALLFLDVAKEKEIDEKVAQHHEELQVSTEPVSEQQINQYTPNAFDKPQSIIISSLGIKARTVEVGLMNANKEGAQQMDSPKNIHDVGWYNCRIGATGRNVCDKYVSPEVDNGVLATVLNGHSCQGRGCIFDKLDQIGIGSEIIITMGSGNQYKYIVQSVEVIDLDKLDMDKVLSRVEVNRPGLNLISCIGQWSGHDSRGKSTMNQRVVVYSVLE